MMEIRDRAFHLGHFSEKTGFSVRPPIKCKHLRTKQVCKACNNLWMSNLEGWAQGRFGNWVKPGFQPEDFAQLETLRKEPIQLLRWLLKTAIMLELALPRGPRPKIVPALYPVAHGKIEPTDFHIWTAYILDSDRALDLHVMKGFPVWNGGVLQPNQEHAEGMNFGLQLNHLAFRLFRCPGARPFVVGNVEHVNGSKCVPLMLTQAPHCPFPHTHIYPTFDTFMAAMEISADPPSSKEKH